MSGLSRSLVAVVAATTIASGASAASRPDSGVRGLVTIGPTCPVERVPPDPNCADRPYDALIRATRAGRTYGRARSGSDGRFRLRLAPGRYRLRASAPQPAVMPYARNLIVTVHRHRFTRIHISFDSGIR